MSELAEALRDLDESKKSRNEVILFSTSLFTFSQNIKKLVIRGRGR